MNTSIRHGEYIEPILNFLREIGLEIELGPVPYGFLPGIQPIANGLIVDTEVLAYPGDLLHEAGHLAVMTPARRAAESPSSTDPAEEMAALAWSYAAAVHIGIPPEVVFHEHGYKGQSQMLLKGFQEGRNVVGLPILWWVGMTTQPTSAGPSIYPRMLQWLRTTTPEDLTEEQEPAMAGAQV